MPTTRQVPIWGNSFIAFVAPPPTAVTMFPPPNFQATSNEVHPSWLNPLKLYAWRCFGCGGVNLVTDSGGDRAFSPYKIEIFKLSCSPACTSGQPGARVGDSCFAAPSGIAECDRIDAEPSAVTYQQSFH